MNKENYEIYNYNSQLKFMYKPLSLDFYRLIVEKENEIQLTPNPTEKNIENLAHLYKKAMENFSGISSEKVLFYNNKLTKLIIGVQKNKKKKKYKTISLVTIC